MNIQPGDTVRHKIKRHDDSDYVGWVDEVSITIGIGYTITIIHVRWIKNDDDPSGATTRHSPEELERLARQGEHEQR